MADSSKRARGQNDSAETEAGKAVEKQLQEEQDQGYRGSKVDPTPNEHYTVAGVLAGKPTPETDADQHAEASAQALGSRFPEKGGDR